jgi:hypothetical protein
MGGDDMRGCSCNRGISAVIALNRAATIRISLSSALLLLFVPLLAVSPTANGQSLQLVDSQSGTAIENGQTLYIKMGTDATLHDSAMPQISAKNGPNHDVQCGTINFTMELQFQGPRFGSKKGALDENNYDSTQSGYYSDSVDCGESKGIDWESIGFYGGEVDVSWLWVPEEGSDTISGNLTFYIWGGYHLDPTLVRSYISGEPPYFGRNLDQETPHVDQFIHSGTTRYGVYLPPGAPNVVCVCPEGVGIGQIDNNGKVGGVKQTPKYVEPALFWSWTANLQEGMKRFNSGRSSALSFWSADYSSMCITRTGNSSCSGGSPLYPSAPSGSGCNISGDPSYFSDGYASINAILGYNAGPGGAHYYRWSGTAWQSVDAGDYVTQACQKTGPL